MKDRKNKENSVSIQLIVHNNCKLCTKVETELKNYSKFKRFVNLEIFNLDNEDIIPNGRGSFITPAVWVNNKLWSFGEVDINRFAERINQLLSNNQGSIKVTNQITYGEKNE